MYRLVIEDDEGKTTLVPLIRDEFSIGRREGNSIRLTQRNVSRKHARVYRENNLFFVEDLGSHNGVRLNGERIAGRRSLREGDIVQIGDYHLMIQRERVVGQPANDVPTETRDTTPGVAVHAQVKTDPMRRLPEAPEAELPPPAAEPAPPTLVDALGSTAEPPSQTPSAPREEARAAAARSATARPLDPELEAELQAFAGADAEGAESQRPGATAPTAAPAASAPARTSAPPAARRGPLYAALGLVGAGGVGAALFFGLRAPDTPPPAPPPAPPPLLASPTPLPAPTPPHRRARRPRPLPAERAIAARPVASPPDADAAPAPGDSVRSGAPGAARASAPRAAARRPATRKLDEIQPMVEPPVASAAPPPSPGGASSAENLARARELLEEGTRVLLSSPPQAIGILRRALALAPRLADVHKQLGIAYNATGNDVATVRHLKRYLSLRPGAADAAEIRRLLDEAEKGTR